MALPQWYAQNGQVVTTKFFGMKANKYLHYYSISQATLAKVAAKNYCNGATEYKCVSSQADSCGQDP